MIGPLAAGAHLAATNPLSPAFQALLDFLGSVLAFFYKLIPNYGVAIILLTLAIRVLLLPLAVKQIRSMQAMQAVQPKVKELQKKYKGNRQKLNEEMMALYREHGVNPLSGCLPLVAQFPVLIALFAVLRVPGGTAHIPHDPDSVNRVSSSNSRLYNDIIRQRTYFLGANLLCSAQQAGRGDIPVVLKKGETSPIKALECGKGVPTRIPYYAFALLMIGTTYFQQRQMQRASPTGAQQQQALTRIMPLLFGFWGFIFPAGLVVYWTTTNAVQIGQQYLMFSRGALGAGARTSPPGGSPSDGGKGLASGRGGRGGTGAGSGTKPGAVRKPGGANRPGDRRPGDRRPVDRKGGAGKGGDGRSAAGKQAGDGKAGGPGRPAKSGSGQRTPPTRKPGSPGRRAGPDGPSTRSPGESGEPPGTTPAGGSDAGDRKKRRKR